MPSLIIRTSGCDFDPYPILRQGSGLRPRTVTRLYSFYNTPATTSLHHHYHRPQTWSTETHVPRHKCPNTHGTCIAPLTRRFDTNRNIPGTGEVRSTARDAIPAGVVVGSGACCVVACSRVAAGNTRRDQPNIGMYEWTVSKIDLSVALAAMDQSPIRQWKSLAIARVGRARVSIVVRLAACIQGG